VAGDPAHEHDVDAGQHEHAQEPVSKRVKL